MYKVYVLIDPITNKQRYIGITCRKLCRRLKAHLRDANRMKFKPEHPKSSNKLKCDWINGLLAFDYKPLIEELFVFQDLDCAKVKEVELINGDPSLLNMTKGGEYNY